MTQVVQPDVAGRPVNSDGNLSHLHFKTEYRSIKEDPATEFYAACLANASLYKRAVGFFRSSVFLVVGDAILNYARRGGRIQLICSPELSADDIVGINEGYARRGEIVERSLIEQINALLAEERTNYRARVLATLIAVKALDIKVALRADRKGIYHEKIGIFRDSVGNTISFKGSTNETWNGWSLEGNFESIEVFCSWRGGLEAARVENHQKHFDSLWSGNDYDVEVFEFPQRALVHLKQAALPDPNDVVPDSEAKPLRQALPHQKDAIAAWEANGCRGIF